MLWKYGRICSINKLENKPKEPITREQFMEILRIVEEIDPSAFIIITNAREVYGKGFKEI